MDIYVVQPGDTVSGIAAYYGVDIMRLYQWVCLSFYQQVGTGADTAVSVLFTGFFLWVYRGWTADSAIVG